MIDYLMNSLISALPAGFLGFFALIVIIALSLLVLSKGADILVDEAVLLSERWGVPKMIIGATIVSLGTTLPEATVSVMSALKGAPGLAMGNAVGSIICDTGLILGIAALIKPLPFKKEVINRQGWIQLGAGVLLVATSFAFGQGLSVFKEGSVIPQFMGWVFLGLLLFYIIRTIQLARKSSGLPVGNVQDEDTLEQDENSGVKSNEPTVIILLKLILGIA